jgi:hypothetical protein
MFILIIHVCACNSGVSFSFIDMSMLQIVHGALDNYEPDAHNEGDDERGEPHHNWVDEVVRCESRGGAVASCDTSPSCMITRPRPEKKDPSLLTRYWLLRSL